MKLLPDPNQTSGRNSRDKLSGVGWGVRGGVWDKPELEMSRKWQPAACPALTSISSRRSCLSSS